MKLPFNLFKKSQNPIIEGRNLTRLFREREQLGLTLMNITTPVVVLNLQKIIIFANKAASKLIGTTSDKILGQQFARAFLITDNLDAISDEVFLKTSSQSSDTLVYNRNNLKLKSTAKDEVYINLFVIYIAEQKFGLSWILVLEDATTQRENERMRLDFVSMAAHELRTPITSIRGYLDVFMKENEGKFSSDHLTLLSQIKSSSLHLASLVENLLSVTKIERGAFTINTAQVSLMDIIKQTISELAFRAQSKNIHLAFDEPGIVVPEIQADKLRIGEVIMNLISNAINYTPSGGAIRIWIEIKNDQIIIHVTDNGLGIPKDQQDRLFNKFYRAHNPLEQKTNGTGLGLYISKAVVELHHGKIWVESAEGKGSTFSFSLPISKTQVDQNPISISEILKTIQSQPHR